MAQSLIEKINNINAATPATKGVYGYDFPLLYGGGLDSRNRDFTHSEYGAAQASQLLVDIAACVNVWEQWLDGITWHIKDVHTGATLLTTDERVLKDENVKGARFFRALKDFRTRYKHSYWKSIATSDWVAGETYIRRVRNEALIPTALQWLNPLATEPVTLSGQIDYFTYSTYDGETPHRIGKQDMAYRMLRRNLFDDLRGYSNVLSVIDESNLSRNVKRAFRQYFRNGMILGGALAPIEGETLSPTEQNRIEDQLRQEHRGVDNAHKWLILPRHLDVTQFDSKDASKNIEVLDNLRGSIMMAMGVPQEIAGNPTDATYENLEATQYGWYRFKGIPYAKDIAEYHNNQIIPYIDNNGIYIEPELSKYEIERPEVVSQDVTASVISLYDAQIKRGKTEADEQLKDIYIVNNRPMHRDIIVKLANTMPSEEVKDRADAEESLANAEAKPMEAEAQVAEAEKPVQPLDTPTTLPQEVEGENEQPTPQGNPFQRSVTISHGNHNHEVPIAVRAYTHDHALAEVETWRKTIKNNKSAQDFEPVYLLGDIADTIKATSHDRASALKALNVAVDTITSWQKAIQATRIDFEDSVQDIMDKALADNNYGRQQWSTAMRKIIRSACTKAYSDGLISGGVLDGTLSEEDQNTLAAHIADQSQYVTNLGEKIFKTEEGLSQALADQKANLWWNKTVLPMYDAGQLSADENRMMEFVGDDGVESCEQCTLLKGQRHRHKWWARMAFRPGIDTDSFDCGGWNCEHRLVPVSAAERN